MGGSHSRNNDAERWAREEAERRAREEADRRAREESEYRERVEAENRAEAARRQAAEETQRAEEAQRIAAEAERRAVKVREALREAEEAARWAHEEAMRRKREEAARRAQEEDERRVREDAMRAAQQEAERRAFEDALRVRKEQEEAAKAILAQEEAQRKEIAAQMEAVAAEDDARKAREAEAESKRLAEEAVRLADEATVARKEAECMLEQGIQRVIWPTQDEKLAARAKHRCTDNLFHIAIAGIAGSGKSSLINAFRGLSNGHPNAAKTGVIETTAEVSRYPDPDPQSPFAWYDVPGAGTLDIPDWQYFNTQGLYVFDAIIVLFDNRFTATDVAILRNCERFNITSYIVRSKSNQHIENLAADMSYDGENEGEEEDEDGQRRYTEVLPKAKDVFINATRETVCDNLEKSGLAQGQRVYIVSKDAMLAVRAGKVPRSGIDDSDLLKDIMTKFGLDSKPTFGSLG